MPAAATPWFMERGGKDALRPLTGLCGVCSLWIVAGHFFTDFAPKSPDAWPTFPLAYFQPVTIFFLLSGVSMAAFYPAARVATQVLRRNFWAKRVARIAPMYWFALALALAPFLHYNREDDLNLVSGLVLTPLFLQSFTLIGNAWCGPLWQVSCFMLCYLAYPRLSTRCTKRPAMWAAAR